MSTPVFGRKWFSPPEVAATIAQKTAFQAGLVRGQDPAMAYGVPAPEGLDAVAYMAGLIEGRSQARLAAQRAPKAPIADDEIQNRRRR